MTNDFTPWILKIHILTKGFTKIVFYHDVLGITLNKMTLIIDEKS